MPRARSFTNEAVVDAALTVVDRSGIAGLTMRAVAAELGLATMSLYSYVESRNHLEELIVESLFAKVDISPPPDCSWREQLATLVGRVRMAFAAHPGVVMLALPHRLSSKAGLNLSETVLGILARAGLDPEDREVVNLSLMAYLLGSFQLEHFGRLSANAEQAMAALSREEYPLLIESASRTRGVTPTQEFERGLDLVLDGAAAMVNEAGTTRDEPG